MPKNKKNKRCAIKGCWSNQDTKFLGIPICLADKKCIDEGMILRRSDVRRKFGSLEFDKYCEENKRLEKEHGSND